MTGDKCRTIRLGALSLLALGSLAASNDPAPDPGPADDSWSKSTGQWFEPIEPGGRLRVVNPHGSVFARFGGYENRVEILATMQRFDSDPRELSVHRSTTDLGLDVIVADDAQNAAGGAGTGPGDDRIDLVVFVPRGVVLDVRTASDAIEAKGLKSELIASSAGGDIRIRSVEGRVRAKTARGRISATLETGVTTEPQELTTETGEIEAHLWEDANLQVGIATSGEISTDFSLGIEHLRYEEPGKRAVATVGRGGPTLSLRSKRGPIRLLRLEKEDTR